VKEFIVVRPFTTICGSFLVGGAITILKNMKANGKDYPIYYGKYNMSERCLNGK
jgi:hypothetical protein